MADPLSPPRPELLALLDAVKDHPDDDTPRLVLADWLDEQDNPLDAERAKFIREDVARARNATKPTLATDKTLTAKVELMKRWLGPVMDFVTNVGFRRGLPRVALSGPRFLKPDVPALLATEAFAFVQFVALQDTGGPRMEAMAAMPEFRFVPGISLHPFSSFG